MLWAVVDLGSGGTQSTPLVIVAGLACGGVVVVRGAGYGHGYGNGGRGLDSVGVPVMRVDGSPGAVARGAGSLSLGVLMLH